VGKGMIAKFLIERGRTWNPANAQLHLTCLLWDAWSFDTTTFSRQDFSSG
jgi:hypothetical protein